jgi:hypothetical protein
VACRIGLNPRQKTKAKTKAPTRRGLPGVRIPAQLKALPWCQKDLPPACFLIADDSTKGLAEGRVAFSCSNGFVCESERGDGVKVPGKVDPACCHFGIASSVG